MERSTPQRRDWRAKLVRGALWALSALVLSIPLDTAVVPAAAQSAACTCDVKVNQCDDGPALCDALIPGEAKQPCCACDPVCQACACDRNATACDVDCGCDPLCAAGVPRCACDRTPGTCDANCSCDPKCPGPGGLYGECSRATSYAFCRCPCDNPDDELDPTLDDDKRDRPDRCDQAEDNSGNNVGGTCWCDPLCGNNSVHVGRVAARGLVRRSPTGEHAIDPTGLPRWMEFDLLGQPREIPITGDVTEALLYGDASQPMSVTMYNDLVTPLVAAQKLSHVAVISLPRPSSEHASLAQPPEFNEYNNLPCFLDDGITPGGPAGVAHPLRYDARTVIVRNTPKVKCSEILILESVLKQDSALVPMDVPCKEGISSKCRSVLIAAQDGTKVYQTEFEIARETAFVAFEKNEPNVAGRCLQAANAAQSTYANFVLDDVLYNAFLDSRAKSLPLPSGFPTGAAAMNLLDAQAFNDCRPYDMVQPLTSCTGAGCPRYLRTPSPVAGAVVDFSGISAYYYDRTDAGGFYSIFYPTPRNEYFTFNVDATMAFSAFNPRVPSSRFYYLTQTGTRSAFQQEITTEIVQPTNIVAPLYTGGSNSTSVVSTPGNTPYTFSNFPVDATTLIVRSYLSNESIVYEPPADTTTTTLDAGPGLATFHLVDSPASAPAGTFFQMVYDEVPQLGVDGVTKHVGLLKEISKPDIRDSETYVFRVSDGYLVGSLWGLLDREVYNYPVGYRSTNLDGTGLDKVYDPPKECIDHGCLLVTGLMRGGSSAMLGAAEAQYNPGLNVPPLFENGGTTIKKPGRFGIELDYGKNRQGSFRPELRAGDMVEIVMVNRATGYIGTTLATYTPDGRGMNGFSPLPNPKPISVYTERSKCEDWPHREGVAGMTNLPCIVMRPPNLKMRVKRIVDVPHGTRPAGVGPEPDAGTDTTTTTTTTSDGETREYVIGFEGSGLTTDKEIVIETEWVDWDGAPLPADLPGYTGRLAKTTPATAGPETDKESIPITPWTTPLSDGGTPDASNVHVTGDRTATSGDGGALADAGGDPAVGGENLTGLFKVEPGKHIAVIKLPETTPDTAHFYVQVDAQPIDRNVDFVGRPGPAKPSFSLRQVCFSGCDAPSPGGGTVNVCTGTGDVSLLQAGWSCVERNVPDVYKHPPDGSVPEDAGTLPDGAPVDAGNPGLPFMERPSSFVPFLVPIYDEAATRNAAKLQLEAIQRQADAGSLSGTPDAGPPTLRVEPVYHWSYRPEHQFTLFTLSQNPIDIEGDSNGKDVFTSLSYEPGLEKPGTVALDPFGKERELLAGVGYETMRAMLGEGSVAFPNLEELLKKTPGEQLATVNNILGKLQPADLLTLQLYQSNDAGNPLLSVPLVLAHPRPMNLTRTYQHAQFKDGVPIIGKVEHDGDPIGYVDDFAAVDLTLTANAKVQIFLYDGTGKKIELPAPYAAPQELTVDEEWVVDANDPTGQPHWRTHPKRYVAYVDYDLIRRASDSSHTGTPAITPDKNPKFMITALVQYTDSSTPPVRVMYPGRLGEDRSGLMLGEVIVHDVLLQDGSLHLNREDFALKGAGPQIDFNRSYTNLGGNKESILGPGWSHSAEKKISALSWGPIETTATKGSVPVDVDDAIRHAHEAFAEVTGADIDHTLTAIAVNGVTFRWTGTAWLADKGHHGKLTPDNVDHKENGVVIHDSDNHPIQDLFFTFTAKDGTKYKYTAPSFHREIRRVHKSATHTSLGDAWMDSLFATPMPDAGADASTGDAGDAGGAVDAGGPLDAGSATDAGDAGVPLSPDLLHLNDKLPSHTPPVDAGADSGGADAGADAATSTIPDDGSFASDDPYAVFEELYAPPVPGHLIEVRDRNDRVLKYTYGDKAHPDDVTSLTDDTGRTSCFEYTEIEVKDLGRIAPPLDLPSGETPSTPPPVPPALPPKIEKVRRLKRVVGPIDSRISCEDALKETPTLPTGLLKPVEVAFDYILDADCKGITGSPGTAGQDEKHCPYGHLKKVTRGDLTDTSGPKRSETYEYELEDGAEFSSFNLTTVLNSNYAEGATAEEREKLRTAYEYHKHDELDLKGQNADLLKDIPNLRPQDVVKHVTYPTIDLTALPQGEKDDPIWFKYSGSGGSFREVVDGRGETTKYTLNHYGNPTKIEEPRGKVTALTWSVDNTFPVDPTDYATNNEILVRSVSQGIVDGQYTWLTTAFTHDAQGNVTIEAGPKADVGSSTPPAPAWPLADEKSVQRVWDQDTSQLKKETDRNGFVQEWTYDAKGNLSSYKDASPEHNTTTYGVPLTGDKRGLRETETRPAPATITRSRLTGDGITHFTYDAYGNPESVTQGQGSKTTYQYDIRGRLTEVTEPNQNDATAHQGASKPTAYAYDAFDDVVKITYPALSPSTLTPAPPVVPFSTNIVTRGYDSQGNKTCETDRNGVKLFYAYTTRDQVAKTIRDAQSGSECSSSLSSKDAAAQPTTDGARTFSYDANGNLLSETDWLAQATKYTYDALNFRQTTKNRLGDPMSEQHDLLGNLSESTDYEGRVTKTSYDALNRVSKETVVGQDGTKLRERKYTYYFEADAEKNLRSVSNWVADASALPAAPLATQGTPTAATKLTTVYTIDERYQRTDRVDPMGGHYVWAYDARGNVVSTTDETERRTLLEYDYQDRVIYSVSAGIGASDHAIVTGFEYDPNGNQTKSHRNAGGTAHDQGEHKTYDEWNRLSSVAVHVDSIDDPPTYFAYDGAGNVLNVRDPRSGENDPDEPIRSGKVHQTTTERDRLGRPTRTIDREGKPTQYPLYDLNGNLREVVSPIGLHTCTDYDAEGRVKSVSEGTSACAAQGATSGLRATEYLKRDKLGNPQDVKNPNGKIASTIYDGDHRPEYICAPDVAATTGDVFGRCTHREYNANGKLSRETDRNGHVLEYFYDGLERITAVVDELHGSIQLADGSTTTERHGIALTLYDAAGRITKGVDKRDQVTENVYDNYGRLQVVKKYGTLVDGGFGALLDQTQLEGESNALLAAKAPRAGAAETIIATYEVDDLGNRLEETDANDHSVEYVYDAHNRVTAIARPLDADTTEPTALAYTKNGTDFSSPTTGGGAGHYSVERREYDVVGNLRKVTDEQGRVTRHSYDFEGREIRAVFSAGSTTEITTRTYDDVGRLQRITRPESQPGGRHSGTYEEHFYDDLGRLIAVVDERQSSTRYGYDNDDNLTRVCLPKVNGGNHHTAVTGSCSSDEYDIEYQYDQRDRRTFQIENGADGTYRTRFEYDFENNVRYLTDANHYVSGQKIEYDYDALNRRTDANYGAIEPVALHWDYDGNGNVLLASTKDTSASGGTYKERTKKDWDLFDRLDKSTQWLGSGAPRVVDPEYDAVGNRKQVVTASGTTTYTYDAQNRLDHVELSAAEIIQHTYFSDGQLARATFPSGVTTEELYEPTGRADSIVTKQASGTVVAEHHYDYDHNGNRLEQTEKLQDPAGAGMRNELTHYGYDASNQLERFSICDATSSGCERVSASGQANDQDFVPGNGVSQTTYTYAGYSRRTEKLTVNGALQHDKTYNYDSHNRLDNVVDAVGNVTVDYNYDANGNLDWRDDGTLTDFTYDARDQLTQVTNSGSTLGIYEYDTSGMRVSARNTDRGDVNYLFDERAVVQETRPDGTVLASYRYADQLVRLDDQSNGTPIKQYYHYDALGSTVALTTDTGTAKATYAVDPWGNVRTPSSFNDSINRRVFTGHESDVRTGLVYMNARYYDPTTGRFLTQDTYLGEQSNAPSLQRYLYAYGNPTVYRDPTGHRVCSGNGGWVDGDTCPEESPTASDQTSTSGIAPGEGPLSNEERAKRERARAAQSAKAKTTPAMTSEPAVETRYRNPIAGSYAADGTQYGLLIADLAERYGGCTACHIPRYLEWNLNRTPTHADVDWNHLDRQAWAGQWIKIVGMAAAGFGLVAELALAEREMLAVTSADAAGRRLEPLSSRSIEPNGQLRMFDDDVMAPRAISSQLKDAEQLKLSFGDARQLEFDFDAGQQPYSARAWRDYLEESYGSENVTSTTVPARDAKNVWLAGQAHPDTGVVFDLRGFPIFDDDALVDLRLSSEQVASQNHTGQLRSATRQLRGMIERGEVPAEWFTSEQLSAIRSGKSNIPDVTWHHHQDVGRMQLVDRSVHATTGHVGGFDTWYQ